LTFENEKIPKEWKNSEEDRLKTEIVKTCSINGIKPTMIETNRINGGRYKGYVNIEYECNKNGLNV
jgi:hypothetical protein